MSHQNKVVVNSWKKLLEVVYEGAWNPELGRYRSNYLFRGLSDSRYKLETTLMRLGGKYAKLEKHIIRNFCKYAHKDLVERDSIWNWMSLAQHHGLPTRLLDWTYSPLNAIHFATANLNKFDQDGVIWAVNYQALHDFIPSRLRTVLRKEGSNVFTAEMLSENVPSINEFMEISDHGFCIFMEPPSMDDRITNQFALFSVMNEPTLSLDEWLIKHPNLWKKIVIKAQAKWEIRDKLDQSNITERVLFPGLDGLGQWLKRVYTPKKSWPKQMKKLKAA